MGLRHVGALDDDAVRVLQVLLELRRASATEAGPQTGHRGAVSYPRLVLDLDRAERGEQLLDEVVLLVVQGRAAEAGEAQRPPGPLALRLPLPRLVAGADDPVGDHVHRLVEVDPLPLRGVRSAIERVLLARLPRRQLQARAALGAQPTTADRGVGVALDLDDLLVLDVDGLAATDRAVRTDRLDRFVRGRGAR